MKLARIVLLLAATAAAARPVHAGTTTSALSGTVHDASGKPLAGAEVQLVDQAFGTKAALKTDAKGKFTQIGMKPGRWTVTVHAAGSPDWTQTVTLALGARETVDVSMGGASAGASGGDAASTAAAAPEAQLAVGGVKLSKEAAAAYKGAQEAMAAGDKARARESLKSLIALEPTLPSPYFVLAQIEREGGDTKAAVDLIHQGLERKPDDVEGLLALGEIQADAGDNAGSAAAFRKAAEAAPSDPRPQRKLGMALLLTQDYAGSAQAFETYLKLAPDAPDAAEKKTLIEETRKLAAAHAK